MTSENHSKQLLAFTDLKLVVFSSGFQLPGLQRSNFGKSVASMSKKASFCHYSIHIDLWYQIKKKTIPNSFLEFGSSDLPLQIEGYILLQCVARKHGKYMNAIWTPKKHQCFCFVLCSTPAAKLGQ